MGCDLWVVPTIIFTSVTEHFTNLVILSPYYMFNLLLHSRFSLLVIYIPILQLYANFIFLTARNENFLGSWPILLIFSQGTSRVSRSVLDLLLIRVYLKGIFFWSAARHHLSESYLFKTISLPIQTSNLFHTKQIIIVHSLSCNW